MMFRGIRRFATTAYRAAELVSQVEASNAYGIKVSQAQGHVNGLVGGMQFSFRIIFYPLISPCSHWQHSTHSNEPSLRRDGM